MKFLTLTIISCLWISATIVQGKNGSDTETDDTSTESDPDPDDEAYDDDLPMFRTSVNDGLFERSNSGAIPKIMGLKSGTTVNRDQFTNWLNSNRISNAKINELLSLVSTAEMFQYFFFNNKLKKYHNLAAKKYGERFANRPVDIMWGDKNLTAFDNQLWIKCITTNVKRHIKPIKDHIKALRINLLQFDEDKLAAALIYIHNTLGNKLESLELRVGREENFQPFKTFKFPAVKELTIFNIDLPNFNYKEMFPSVESLTVIKTSIKGKNWFPNNFPRLKRLQVQVGNDCIDKSEVVKALETNSKLTDFGNAYGDSSLPELINSNYPNIVNLAIINPLPEFKSLKEPIKMNYVQRFLFAHEVSCRYAKFFQFSQLRELNWHCVRAPRTLFRDIMKNNSNQIEIINVDDAVLTNKDLQQMAELDKLVRVSIGFNDEAAAEIGLSGNGKMTGNGLANLVKNSKTLAGLRLKGVDIKFAKKVYAAFKAIGLGKWIVIPLKRLNSTSNLYFKNPTKNVQWDDEMQFLRTTTFVGY